MAVPWHSNHFPMKQFALIVLLLVAAQIATAQHFPPNLKQIQRPQTLQTTARSGFDPALKPFYHGVASGDPGTSSVVLWTRITPDAGQNTLSGNWYLALDTAFSQPVQNGSWSTDAARDFTVNIQVQNLAPGSTYYYYFEYNGQNSLVGRAKTCPDQAVDNLKFAVVSCSNYEAGYFNAYRSLAGRNDLDAVLHLGDYIYEYGAGTYGLNLPDRVNEPATEILTIADYRTRYSLYRLDPDLIRLHQQHTFITIWDDHESANDSYTDGAQNHQSGEGSWTTRKAVSKKVYYEWMPMRAPAADSSVYRKISYGGLCDIFMLDTRLEGRVAPPPHFDTPDNPPRNIISAAQFNWLVGGLKQSGARWKVLGNQVLFSTFNVGFAGGAFDGQPDPANIDSIRVAEDAFIDNWESYPTQRNALLDTIRNADIDNVVIVTGDSHCSWAFDVTKQAVNYPNPSFFNIPQPNLYNAATREGYTPATGDGSWAVEFGTPSISSPNLDETVGAATTTQFETFLNQPIPLLFNANYNPHLKYVDLDRHGYTLLDLKAEAAQGDFYYVPSVQVPGGSATFGTAARTLHAANRLQLSTNAAPDKLQQDIPTPTLPFGVSSAPEAAVAQIFSCFPNPASDVAYVQMGFSRGTDARVLLYDQAGKLCRVVVPGSRFEAGVYNLRLPLSDLPAGVYFLRMESAAGTGASWKVVKN